MRFGLSFEVETAPSIAGIWFCFLPFLSSLRFPGIEKGVNLVDRRCTQHFTSFSFSFWLVFHHHHPSFSFSFSFISLRCLCMSLLAGFLFTCCLLLPFLSCGLCIIAHRNSVLYILDSHFCVYIIFLRAFFRFVLSLSKAFS